MHSIFYYLLVNLEAALLALNLCMVHVKLFLFYHQVQKLHYLEPTIMYKVINDIGDYNTV